MQTIEHTVEFPIPSERLFDAYLDPIEHARITGSDVKIGREVGAAFMAFNGMITGRNLMIVPKRLIVQAWRASHWKETDLDSILVLVFEPGRIGGKIKLAHVNVPDHDHQGVTEGWEKYYWTPWRAHLARAGATIPGTGGAFRRTPGTSGEAG
jgi:activator of HSP90 ATPase